MTEDKQPVHLTARSGEGSTDRTVDGVQPSAEPQPCKRCDGDGYTNEGDPEIGNAYFECTACGGTGRAANGVNSSVAPSLSLKRLCALLVEHQLVYAEAVDDAEGYDEGVTMGRIEALHRALTPGVREVPRG